MQRFEVTEELEKHVIYFHFEHRQEIGAIPITSTKTWRNILKEKSFVNHGKIYVNLPFIKKYKVYFEKYDSENNWTKVDENGSIKTYFNDRRIDFERITSDDYLSGTNVTKSGDEWYRVIASHFDKQYLFDIISKHEKIRVRKVKESKMNLSNLIECSS